MSSLVNTRMLTGSKFDQWDSTYNTVQSNSADWSYVAANSSSGGSDVSSLSSNWENTYNTVQSNSADWASPGLSALDYQKWTFTSNGVVSAFDIPSAVSDNESAYLVTINSVIQDSSTYTIILSSEKLQFTAAPVASADISVTETRAIQASTSTTDIIDIAWGDGVNAIVAANAPDLVIPYAIRDASITSWYVEGQGGTGSCVIDALCGFAGSETSIAGSEKPTITSGTAANDTTITTWTNITAGNRIVFRLDSSATFTYITCRVIYSL